MSRVRFALVPLAILLAACTSSGSSPGHTVSSTNSTPTTPARSPTQTSEAAHQVSWPTYHGDAGRSGFLRGPAITPPLRRAWSRDLDGAVYAQPIVVGNTVMAATENNTVYALRSDSGEVIWRRHLAPPVPRSQLPCGNIDPLGITGTPAYDASSGLVFLVTESADGRHDLRAMDARTGRRRWSRNLDVVQRNPLAQQQRSALLLANGRVYVAFGGLFGDCGNYIGYVTAVATNGRGPVAHYEVPSAREAGMWASPGPIEDPLNGDLLIAVGNGSETGGRFDGSDSVLRLSPTLQRRALFAPSTWAQDNAADLDLGSMSPVLAQHHVVIAGKRGTVYLLPPALGGIGGEQATLTGCSAYGGAATVGQVVFLPCSDGIRRLEVVGNTMRWDWQLRGVAGSPLLVGRLLYALSQDSGDLYAVDAITGRVRARLHIGEVTRFATPAPAGRLIVIGTRSGVTAVAGSR